VKKATMLLIMGTVLLAITNLGFAEKIKLMIPIVEDSPDAHVFYHELLETALKEAGHTPEFVVRKKPQIRIKHEMGTGLLSIYWMVESGARNQAYIPIKIGLTNGLIGKRILFIKKGDQHLYDNVQTLDDFRKLNLVGGMGTNWFDVKVWKANNLKYLEQAGNWNVIYKKIGAGHDFNYFSRGLNEIVKESAVHPYLDIESGLVLSYDRDFLFYLSKSGENAGASYKDTIEAALKKAKESGLIEKMVRKYL
jgi:hypothetical protein